MWVTCSGEFWGEIHHIRSFVEPCEFWYLPIYFVVFLVEAMHFPAGRYVYTQFFVYRWKLVSKSSYQDSALRHWWCGKKQKTPYHNNKNLEN